MWGKETISEKRNKKQEWGNEMEKPKGKSCSKRVDGSFFFFFFKRQWNFFYKTSFFTHVMYNNKFSRLYKF